MSLPSDSSKRKDGLLLKSGNIDEAQAAKEELEERQRHERKLREAAEKRRQEGGAKLKLKTKEIK